MKSLLLILSLLPLSQRCLGDDSAVRDVMLVALRLASESTSAYEYYKTGPYTFNQEDSMGRRTGYVSYSKSGNLTFDFNFYERLRSGAITSEPTRTIGFITETTYLSFIPSRCCVISLPLSKASNDLRVLCGFLPQNWMNYSEANPLYRILESADLKGTVSYEETESHFLIRTEPKAPYLPTDFRFEKENLLIESYRIIGGKGAAQYEWSVEGERCRLKHFEQVGDDGTVKMSFKSRPALGDEAPHFENIDTFLRSLPNGTRYVRYGQGKEPVSDSYLGRNKATAKRDYEYRLLGEKIKKRRALEERDR